MLGRLAASVAKDARFHNVALLVCGYGFGQGSIFLAQTWLVATGQLELLALFGTHFAFAILGVLVVESGSLITLSRHTAALPDEPDSAALMWQAFWETSVFRAGLALVVVAVGAAATVIAASPFSTGYALCAAPAFLLWAVGASGLLDGLRFSGLSGASVSIPYAASALALVFARDLAPAEAGALLGAAFSGGYLLTVVVQFLALRVLGRPMRLAKVTRRGVATAAHDGLLLLGGTLPGQLYFRAQLLICSAWLGPGATALFVYVKQIISATAQLIGFVRRVEFPALVATLAQPTDAPARTIWRAQLLGTRLAFVATLCLAAAGLATVAVGGLVADTGRLLAGYSLLVATSAVYLGYSQGLAAMGRYRALLAWSTTASLLGLAATAALAPIAGIYGFLIADVLSSALGIVAAIALLGRTR